MACFFHAGGDAARHPDGGRAPVHRDGGRPQREPSDGVHQQARRDPAPGGPGHHGRQAPLQGAGEGRSCGPVHGLAGQVRRYGPAKAGLCPGLSGGDLEQAASGAGAAHQLEEPGEVEAAAQEQGRAGPGGRTRLEKSGPYHAGTQAPLHHRRAGASPQRAADRTVHGPHSGPLPGGRSGHPFGRHGAALRQALRTDQFRPVDALPGREEGVERQVLPGHPAQLGAGGSRGSGDRGRAHTQLRDYQSRHGQAHAHDPAAVFGRPERLPFRLGSDGDGERGLYCQRLPAGLHRVGEIPARCVHRQRQGVPGAVLQRLQRLQPGGLSRADSGHRLRGGLQRPV